MSDILKGKIGRADVGATTLEITGWSFEPTVEELDSTHTGSAGYGKVEDGVKRATLQISANWDADAHPTADPPNLVVGTKVSNIKLFLGDPADSNYVDIPSAMVTSKPVSSDTGSLVTWQCNLRVDGTWTEPT